MIREVWRRRSRTATTSTENNNNKHEANMLPQINARHTNNKHTRIWRYNLLTALCKYTNTDECVYNYFHVPRPKICLACMIFTFCSVNFERWLLCVYADFRCKHVRLATTNTLWYIFLYVYMCVPFMLFMPFGLNFYGRFVGLNGWTALFKGPFRIERVRAPKCVCALVCVVWAHRLQ